MIRYLSSAGQRLLVVNLGADLQFQMNDPLLAPVPGSKWEMLWNSEQPHYGGGGAVPFGDAGSWLIRGVSSVILSATPAR